MRLSISVTEWLVAAVVIGGIGIAAWQFLGAGAAGSAQRTDVQIPEFSLVATAGKGAFDAKNPLARWRPRETGGNAA